MLKVCREDKDRVVIDMIWFGFNFLFNICVILGK